MYKQSFQLRFAQWIRRSGTPRFIGLQDSNRDRQRDREEIARVERKKKKRERIKTKYNYIFLYIMLLPFDTISKEKFVIIASSKALLKVA